MAGLSRLKLPFGIGQVEPRPKAPPLSPLLYTRQKEDDPTKHKMKLFFVRTRSVTENATR